MESADLSEAEKLLDDNINGEKQRGNNFIFYIFVFIIIIFVIICMYFLYIMFFCGDKGDDMSIINDMLKPENCLIPRHHNPLSK